MKKSLCIMMCICIVLSSAISVHAGQIEEDVEKNRNSVSSFYSVLTKDSAFVSINGSNAKGYISTDSAAYQEAFWIASCMEVCRNFEEWNAIVPESTWRNVIFPGFETDFTGRGNYSEFRFYDIILKFNVLFSDSRESLYVDSFWYSD